MLVFSCEGDSKEHTDKPWHKLFSLRHSQLWTLPDSTEYNCMTEQKFRLNLVGHYIVFRLQARTGELNSQVEGWYISNIKVLYLVFPNISCFELHHKDNCKCVNTKWNEKNILK